MFFLLKIGALTSKPYAFNARPWELKTVNSIDIFDTFGSSIRLDYRDKEILRVLPRNAEWISDKIRFFYDGFKYKRFHYFYLRKKGILVKTTILKTFFFIKLIFNYINQFCFNLGNLVDLETVFLTKALTFSFLLKGKPSFITFGQNVHTSNIRDFFYRVDLLKKVETILLIGVNLRLENPILNAILRKQILLRPNLKIFVLGSIVTYNYYVKQLGVSGKLLNEILKGKHKLSVLMEQCNDILLLFGSEFFLRSDADYFFNLALQLRNKKLQVMRFVSNVGLLGGLELGSFSFDYLNYLRKNKNSNNDFCLKYNILTFNNNFFLNSTDILIYQSSNFSDLALAADLIIPEAVFIEKETMYLTFNNLVKSTTKIYNPPKQVMEGWDFLQCLLFFSYKLSLIEETFLIKLFITENLSKLKNQLKLRLYKRTLFSYGTFSLLLNEPFKKEFFLTTAISNIINLYYNTNVLTNASVNLTVRTQIEETSFCNFESKNGKII